MEIIRNSACRVLVALVILMCLGGCFVDGNDDPQRWISYTNSTDEYQTFFISERDSTWAHLYEDGGSEGQRAALPAEVVEDLVELTRRENLPVFQADDANRVTPAHLHVRIMFEGEDSPRSFRFGDKQVLAPETEQLIEHLEFVLTLIPEPESQQ